MVLDADHDAVQQGRYHVFELKHLFEMDDKILVPVLLYLFHRIEQRLDGSPTLIIIEELWAPLMRSLFADTIKQWLLTLRKYNAAVVLVAHSPTQLAATPNAQVIVDSCPTRIFLPNASASASGARHGYHDLGLNDQEIALVASAVPKRDYYLTSPNDARRFELGLGDVAQAFLTSPDGMTADVTRQHVRQLMDQHGPDWPVAWLRFLGLHDWAARWTTDHANTLIPFPDDSTCAP
jgi:type IV secretion system protein VirB4